MGSEGTLLLTRRNVAELLGIEECIVAVEHAFRSYVIAAAIVYERALEAPDSTVE